MSIILESNMENPIGWKIVNLGDVITTIKGKKPKVLGAQSKELTIPYISIKAFEKKEFEQFTNDVRCPQCNEQDILLVWDGARSGLVGTGVNGVIGSTLTKLFCYDINQKYLYYFLKKHYDTINKNTKGIGIPHVNPNLLWNLHFPVPPLNEQKRIVSKIDELFSLIEFLNTNAIKNKDKLMRYKISLLEKAFFGELTKEWRSKHSCSNTQNLIKQIILEKKVKNKKFEEFTIQEQPSKSLPGTWTWTCLGNYADCSRGKFSVRPRNDPRYYGGKYPFIQIGDLSDDGGIVNHHKQTLNERGLKVSKSFPKGTVTIAIVGATIGNTGILDYEMCFPDSLIGINSQSLSSNKFIEYYLRLIKGKIRNISYSSGGQPNINLDTLNYLPIPLPSLEEQEKIISQLEIHFSILKHNNILFDLLIKQLTGIRKSILKLACEGKLVPQDPNDEPAEILLEKIKQEKEKIIKAKPKPMRKKNDK